jgi:hypothetical protein
MPLSASMLNLGPPRLFHSHLLADVGSARHEFICDADTVSTRRGALGGERKRRCAHNVQTGGGTCSRLRGREQESHNVKEAL